MFAGIGVHTPKQKTWLSIMLFGLWLCLLATAYWYFLVKPKQWFDHAMQQPPVLADSGHQEALRRMLLSHFPHLNPDQAWFVRLMQSDCSCERFVELYHQAFANRLAPKQMQVVTVDLASASYTDTDRALLNTLIPSTPAVVVFDTEGTLLYFGPYHQNGICSAENSYLEPVLDAFQQGEKLSVLNTLVYGCFCAAAR